MNERIKELAEQAEQVTKAHFNFDWDGTPRELFDMYFNEKFAELLIQECFDVVINDGRFHDAKGIIKAGKLVAMEHFGVK